MWGRGRARQLDAGTQERSNTANVQYRTVQSVPGSGTVRIGAVRSCAVQYLSSATRAKLKMEQWQTALKPQDWDGDKTGVVRSGRHGDAGD